MWKYVIIANREIKMFYRFDELGDAVQAYEYTRKFYSDTTLNVMKYSEENHSIELVNCKLEDYNNVFGCSRQ